MKKRFPAVILALALCFGLAAPTFAADNSTASAGSFVYDLNDPDMDMSVIWDSGLFEPADFSVREYSAEYRSEPVRVGSTTTRVTYMYLTYGKARRLEPAIFPGVHTLPAGTTFTVKGVRPTDSISIWIYADPDGDGIYDEQLLSNNSEKGVIPVPPAVKYGQEIFKNRATSGIAASSFSADSIGIQTAETGSDSLGFTVDSDSMYETFGGNTILQYSVMDAPNEEGISYGRAEGVLFISKDGSAPRFELSSFTDVPQWCAGAVQWAAWQDITVGATKTTFAPAKDCTQEQILTFLHRAEGKPPVEAQAPIDVAADYADAVNWAYETGLIDESFDPKAPCTRADAVNYIWQALGSELPQETSAFPDVDADADYAKAVDWAVENGIVEGYKDGTFGPDKVCNRGVIVTLLHRAYEEGARLTVGE